MLSPHEFATLMLIRHAPDQLDNGRAEIDTLLARQLIMLEHRADGDRRVHLTPRGHAMLDAFGASGARRRRASGRPPALAHDRDEPDAQCGQWFGATAADAGSAQPQTQT
ncbi:hypothetical protein [Burkholderia vietnamiensis]|uniref:hypothetical protein n=1 Tax=Burkholderia vietnamiensis TaxID=60552 RepID=UPI00075522B1|nr:hypothetical protein [Burkholderia vietnamiensis]KVE21922.1 hypothetical protein WI93_22270 [Burkholderia vietnamiensis]KVE94068.1 hypothetical protein WJ03_24465 [Burkholderia vietnamiensis]MBR7971636.1 hypothetical protein [Burkholderia vietnamiensis]